MCMGRHVCLYFIFLMKKEKLMYSVEEFDREKTKILKYIMYKKRTEN